MKIKRIKIENFRSLKSTEFILTDLNIFIGQNNCGKTNFFEAIEFFFNGVGRGCNIDDLKFLRKPENSILVEIEFSGALHGASKMQNAANKTKIENALNGSDNVTFTRSSENPKKRSMIVNGQEVQAGTGFDAALNDFLPKFEYINTKQYYDCVAKYSKSTPIGIMLSGVLSTILEKNQQYKDFQDTFKNLFEGSDSEIKAEFEAIGNKVKVHLEKQFPDTAKVRFEVATPIFDDLLKNFDTTVDDGVNTLAEEKGDGMQRALMLAIIQAYAEFRKSNDDAGKSFIFFIDEAELHLHPTAQRNLKNVLIELSQSGDQVFINTHSSVFVADNVAGQSILKVEKDNGETEIKLTSENEKPYIVYDLLGGSPADLLLPKNFLVIEGQSEIEFFTRVISRLYADKPKIQLIKAFGDIDQAERTINAIEKIYTPLEKSIYKDKSIILIDQPSTQTQGGVTQFLQQNRNLSNNNQFYQLPVRDIEQYYPSQTDTVYGNWRKTQAELDATNTNGQKVFTSTKKKQLAKHVGDKITKTQFENDMKVCFDALQRCWQLSY
jgi:predicted ATP-dependent endonuclease of OLD family